MAELIDAVKAWMQVCTEELEDEEALPASSASSRHRASEHLAEHKREAGH